ncbi:MAG: acyl-homoserine-lactone synthase [Pseudomonadota bacterium]
MLRYIYGSELDHTSRLARTMFEDRAWQFHERQGWEVDVKNGQERDQYDTENPLYVIWELEDGTHGGSMRLLPTTGRTMVNDHFLHLTDGVAIRSPFIWECTRFCLGPRADRRTAAALMLGGGDILQGFGIEYFVGVFDARMERIYRAIGSEPEILGNAGQGREKISVGLWAFTRAGQERVAARAGLSLAQSQRWFDAAFTDVAAPAHLAVA